MNDFQTLERSVRELSCRLCLCNDVTKLKPLSAEVKRKIKKLFDFVIRSDDSLPKAICHECLQQLSALHLYAVKVEKTQKFLEFHKLKLLEDKRDPTLPSSPTLTPTLQPMIAPLSNEDVNDVKKKNADARPKSPRQRSPSAAADHQQGDITSVKQNKLGKKKTASELKFMEAMTLDEFAKCEKVEKHLLHSNTLLKPDSAGKKNKIECAKGEVNYTNDTLDSVVIMDGRPARQGSALDRQITLFYKMECCICHERDFHFRSLMKHYKERHGVPGYVTCCDKKFHYFYPKKIIEHMAFHLQPNIFMCNSCHQNFQTSQDLHEHQSNGGRSEGKILCPRCSERYPTYRELGTHLVSHRIDKLQCDYCGKALKHHHRKKTINHMEDLILCTQCIRTLRSLERQEKEIKEKIKAKGSDVAASQKYQKFRQAMGLSGDEDGSTD